MKFSEFTIGETYTTNKVVLTESDIVQFGKVYDPQYFHIDKAAAEAGPFNSLIASGFQTVAVVWAEWVRQGMFGQDCIGGIKAELEWSAPVKPEDELYGIITILDKQKSETRNRGLVTFGMEVFNQDEICVAKSRTSIFMAD